MLILVYNKAIEIQPSVIGYIAKSIALVGKGEKHKGYAACDIAFEHFHSSHVSFLLLVKVRIFPTWVHLAADMHQAIIMFIAGEHRDAISRVDDLIATVHFHAICCVVQACVCLLIHSSDSTDICNRHICISSWEPCTWRPVTTRMRYSRSSVHEPKCDATPVNPSL